MNNKQLPYQNAIHSFEKFGKIMHRNDIYGSGPPSPIASEEAYNHLKQYLGEKVLDVGCGIGAYLLRLKADGYDCTGVEVDQGFVDTCKKQDLNVVRSNGLTLRLNRHFVLVFSIV